MDQFLFNNLFYTTNCIPLKLPTTISRQREHRCRNCKDTGNRCYPLPNIFKYNEVIATCGISGIARTLSLVGHTPWNGTLHINYYSLPPYHPVNILNITSVVIFWHAPSEFYFILDLTRTILGLFLNFLFN